MMRKRDIKAQEKANQIVQSKQKTGLTNEEEKTLVEAIETHGRDWTKVMNAMYKVAPSRPYNSIVGYAIRLAKLY